MTDGLTICPCSALVGSTAAVARNAELHGVMWIQAHTGPGEAPKVTLCVFCGYPAPHLRKSMELGAPVLPPGVVALLRLNKDVTTRLNAFAALCISRPETDVTYWHGVSERLVVLCSPSAAASLHELDPEVEAVWRLTGNAGVAALTGEYPELLEKLWASRSGRFG